MIAGIYPALVLSGFQPIKVLKNMKLIGSGGGAWLRQALVVIQFSLSVLLIVSTTIVYRQTQFLNNTDIGFNKARANQQNANICIRHFGTKTIKKTMQRMFACRITRTKR